VIVRREKEELQDRNDISFVNARKEMNSVSSQERRDIEERGSVVKIEDEVKGEVMVFESVLQQIVIRQMGEQLW
jgi:hypothetical protein